MDNFTATSTDLYVNTGSQLITYTLSGAQVGSFALAVGDRQPAGNEVTQPVVDPSGNIYLASYYGPDGGQVLPDRPAAVVGGSRRRQPHRALLGGHRLGLPAAGQRASRTRSGSDLINLSTGAVSGSFPLFDNFDYVTQESDGNLLFSGNGYVETIEPDRQVLSSFGSSPGPRGQRAHTGSGSQFYYPAQAAQGPDGTIYTADPLDTIEATSPQGYLEGTTTLGQNSNGGVILAMGGYNFYLVGSTFYLPGRAAVQQRRRQHLVDLAVHPHRLPRRRPCARPTPSDGEPGCRRRPRPTTSPPGPPPGHRHLRPVVGCPRPPTSSCPTRSRTPPR